MVDIVVGIDGSEPSLRALAAAFEQASLRPDAVVTVVHAYRVPHPPSGSGASYSYLPGGTLERLTADEDERRQQRETMARQHAEAVVSNAVANVGGPPDGCVVKPFVTARDAARTLVEASRNADLLVVGSRGRGGFRGLLMGSVSQQALHHATCQVLVVR
jgi:nucleotide-binding universal stress UspA family protein